LRRKKDVSSRNSSRNSYEAPGLLGDRGTHVAETHLARLLVQSQKILQEEGGRHGAKAVSAAYANTPTIDRAGAILVGTGFTCLHKYSVGNVSPVRQEPHRSGSLCYFRYSFVVQKGGLDKQLRSLVRYAVILQKKILQSRAPFRITLGLGEITRNFLLDEVIATVDIAVNITSYVVRDPAAIANASSKKATEFIMEHLWSRSAPVAEALFSSQQEVFPVSFCQPEAMGSINHTPFPCVHPDLLTMGPSVLTKNLSEDEIPAFLETNLLTMLENFADANSAVLYCDALSLILETLNHRAAYLPELHSRVF